MTTVVTGNRPIAILSNSQSNVGTFDIIERAFNSIFEKRRKYLQN